MEDEASIGVYKSTLSISFCLHIPSGQTATVGMGDHADFKWSCCTIHQKWYQITHQTKANWPRNTMMNVSNSYLVPFCRNRRTSLEKFQFSVKCVIWPVITGSFIVLGHSYWPAAKIPQKYQRIPPIGRLCREQYAVFPRDTATLRLKLPVRS